jgi:hypothetical protein
VNDHQSHTTQTPLNAVAPPMQLACSKMQTVYNARYVNAHDNVARRSVLFAYVPTKFVLVISLISSYVSSGATKSALC